MIFNSFSCAKAAVERAASATAVTAARFRMDVSMNSSACGHCRGFFQGGSACGTSPRRSSIAPDCIIGSQEFSVAGAFRDIFCIFWSTTTRAGCERSGGHRLDRVSAGHEPIDRFSEAMPAASALSLRLARAGNLLLVLLPLAMWLANRSAPLMLGLAALCFLGAALAARGRAGLPAASARSGADSDRPGARRLPALVAGLHPVEPPTHRQPRHVGRTGDPACMRSPHRRLRLVPGCGRPG
ncbi:hypothetical protein BTHI11S_01688 [Bosea thiooxidans]